jgi:restriction system protein
LKLVKTFETNTMKIDKGAKIKCKKCNKLYYISPEDFDEPDTTSDERSMGYEIQYTWDYEFNCDKCKNELKITIEAYEYPVGILNYQEINAEGCNIIDEPSLEINNEDEND